MKGISRRKFIRNSSLLIAGAASVAAAPGKRLGHIQKAPYFKRSGNPTKIIVLGMDGMEPSLVRQFVAEGLLPNFAKMISQSGNYFGSLGTTMPALSPVAWSSFISGTNPGGHGIFDFIHRDPATFTPYLSTSRSSGASSSIKLGNWALPLGAGKVDLMRFGQPFWSVLNEADIPSTVYQIPANFPVVDSPTRAISGMGTPDLLGTYGTFTYFSESFVSGSDDFSSGKVVRLRPLQHKATAQIDGPANPFRRNAEMESVPVDFVRDPVHPLIKIQVQDATLLLKQGEWSDWIPLRFEYVPLLVSVSGMVRFYVKEVHPKIKVYCTPVNVDSADPALPICSPPEFSAEMSEHIGRFYTQGLPADTKALSYNVLDDDEYFSQAKLVLEESMRALEYGLNHLNDGFFFFYFSSIDQNSHMLMRAMDPNHPLYNPKASPEVKNAIRYLYSRMDDALGMALSHTDSNTLLFAISDHGFTTFYREFHLNTWLVEQGYTVLTDPKKLEDSRFFDYVDWKRTKAYALGFNGIYLNRSGREKHGIVSEEEGAAIKQDIIQKLVQVRDPKDGARMIEAVYDSKDIYSGPFTALAPDLQIGYRRGYRVSDESVLGRFSREIVRDRTDKWSADHCMDPRLVPGMLLMNRECKLENPALWDMAATILKGFNLNVPSQMAQRSIITGI